MRGRFSNRRRGVGLALAGVLVLGGLVAWERLRLNAMERRLVGIWVETQDPDSVVPLRSGLLTLHPDGRFKEEFGWIEGRTDLRWKFRSRYIDGMWWCEGDELFLRHFSEGPARDLWESILVRWGGRRRRRPSPSTLEQIRLSFDAKGILTFASELRSSGSVTQTDTGESVTSIRHQTWEQLSRSPTDSVVAEPDPQRQRAHQDWMNRRNSR